MEGAFLFMPCGFVVLFVGVFLVAIGVFVFIFAKGFAEWSHNNRQPVQAVPARVIGKRTNTTGMSGSSVSTWYYTTFELPSGERREFAVGGQNYGLLAEGDHGTLTFQGTRYHGFERTL